MNIKHTPGPWNQSRYCPVDVVIDGDIWLASARDTTNGITREQAIANARLIAAAPDLLDALRTIVANAASVQMDPQWTVQVARTAIAKATSVEA